VPFVYRTELNVLLIVFQGVAPEIEQMIGGFSISKLQSLAVAGQILQITRTGLIRNSNRRSASKWKCASHLFTLDCLKV
jgi:hypothetical protein